MNPRIACLTLLALSLSACGQSGALVLPDTPDTPPKAAEARPVVVAPVQDGADAAAQKTSDDQKKEAP